MPTSYDPNHPNEKEVPLPNAPREALSKSYMELQPPLSRRGHGPGIISFLAPPPPECSTPAETLDPEPVLKWSEEGYAVVAIKSDVPKKDIKKALETGVEALKAHKDVDIKDKFAVFGKFGFATRSKSTATAINSFFVAVYNPEILESVSSAVSGFPICLLASYCGAVPKSSCTVPVVEHIFPAANSMNMEDALACPIPDPDFNPMTETRRSYHYATPSRSPFSCLPHYPEEVYDHSAAALSHTRTLTFLKQKIGGPWYDLERVRKPKFQSRAEPDTVLAL